MHHLKESIEEQLDHLPWDIKIRFWYYLSQRKQLIQSWNFDCFGLIHFLARKQYIPRQLNAKNEWTWTNYKQKDGTETWVAGDFAMNYIDYGNGKWDTKHASMYIGNWLFLGLNWPEWHIVIDTRENLEKRTWSNATVKMIPNNTTSTSKRVSLLLQ